MALFVIDRVFGYKGADDSDLIFYCLVRSYSMVCNRSSVFDYIGTDYPRLRLQCIII